MDFYFVVLFFHISGAFILFMGMSLEWVGNTRLNNSTEREQAIDWVNFLSSLKFAFMSGGILLLITGIYLAATKWGWTPWILVSFLLWLFLTLHGSVVTGRRVAKFNIFLNSNPNVVNSELNLKISNLKLMNLLQSRLAVGLGAVFIMTVKPNLQGSIIIVIIAIIFGIIPLLSKRKTAVPKLANAGQDK